MQPTLRGLALAASLALAALGAQAQTKAPAATVAQATRPAAAPSGAINDPEVRKAGETAAHAWLLLLDRADWGTAWDASSGMFRQSVPLATWMDNVPQVRAPFGAFIERHPSDVVYKKSLPGRPDGDYVTVIFESKFEKKPDVLETVTTVREPDGRWRVTGYTAR